MQIQWTQEDGSLKTLSIPPGGLTIGRGPQYDIYLNDSGVSGSRPHARILAQDDGYYVEDCRSKNGTQLNGKSLAPEYPTPLAPNAVISIGRFELRCLAPGANYDIAPPPLPYQQAAEEYVRPERRPRAIQNNGGRSIPFIEPEAPPMQRDQKAITVGRSAQNDIVLDDAAVSGHHAELTLGTSGYTIRDLNSKNGTYVNEKRISGAVLLQPDDRVRIGKNRFKLPESKGASGDVAVNKSAQLAQLKPVSDGRHIRLDAFNLRREVDSNSGHLVLLQDVSLTIEPGEMVAVIGGSGAGKTTLMLALNGYSKANSGQVLLNGVDFYQNAEVFSTTMGYVPQQDIVHGDLPVGSALHYAALLRLPPDTTTAEIEALIDKVLDQLSLTHRKDNMISTLSGGERKRVNMGVELLTRPSILFLDEPTTGLDAGTEKKVTLLMRELAGAGCTVITVTHAVQTLHYYDKVIVMAPGGRLVYCGRLGPEELKREFGLDDYADLYDHLKQRPAINAALDRPHAGATQGALRIRQSPVAQWMALVQRYVELMRNDRVNLIQLLLQTPFVGLLFVLLFKSDTFEPNGSAHIIAGGKIAILMALAMTCFCLLNSYREIIKEVAIYRRERHVALGIWPYILSKIAVLTTISLVQTVLLLLVVNFKITLHLAGPDIGRALLVLLLGSLNTTLMGLLVSALSKSSDQATTTAGLLLLTQVIFSGFIPIESDIMQKVSDICAMRWMYGGLGNLLHINALTETAVNRSLIPRGPEVSTPFDASFQTSIIHLVILAVVMLCLVWFSLWLPEEIALRKGVQA